MKYIKEYVDINFDDWDELEEKYVDIQSLKYGKYFIKISPLEHLIQRDNPSSLSHHRYYDGLIKLCDNIGGYLPYNNDGVLNSCIKNGYYYIGLTVRTGRILKGWMGAERGFNFYKDSHKYLGEYDGIGIKEI